MHPDTKQNAHARSKLCSKADLIKHMLVLRELRSGEEVLNGAHVHDLISDGHSDPPPSLNTQHVPQVNHFTVFKCTNTNKNAFHTYIVRGGENSIGEVV